MSLSWISSSKTTSFLSVFQGTHKIRAPLALRVRWFLRKSLGSSCKVWGARFMVQTFCFSGKSWELGFPSWFKVLFKRWALRCKSLSLSYLFQSGYFLSCPMCRSHPSSFWISPWGNYPYIAVYLVCLWEEGKSRACHSIWLLADFKANKIKWLLSSPPLTFNF